MSNIINLLNFGGGKNKTLAYCSMGSQWTGGSKHPQFEVDFPMETIECYFAGRKNSPSDNGNVQCSVNGNDWVTIFSGSGMSSNFNSIDVKGKGYKFIRANLNPGNTSSDSHISVIGFAVNTKLNH